MDLNQRSKYKLPLSYNYNKSTFICPKCRKTFPIKDAICKMVPTDTKVEGYVRHGGNASTTIYRTTLNSIRYCSKCTRAMKFQEYLWWAYFLVPCLIFNAILIHNFFDSPEIFGKGESFWGKLEQRDVWSLIGWIFGCGFVGMTILVILKKIIELFIKDSIPSLEQAIKDNSLNT